MIETGDIERAVADLLKSIGFSVVPVDAEDGFQKPACSIDVFPTGAEAQSWYMEEDSFAVDVAYYPRRETQRELVRAAGAMKRIFLYTPLIIQSRSIDTDRVDFYREGMALHMEVEYTVVQNPHEEEEQPDGMEFLELEME